LDTVETGLERLLTAPPEGIGRGRLGLLCNAASVNPAFRHARDLIDRRFPGRLKALFSPQHGFYAEKQDNMVESGHMKDPKLDIPIFSLYGETRVPTEAMLQGIDILLVDLQDVGTRVYTFATTLSYCLETAKRRGIPVLVLDRPNPVNGISVEGNCLSPACASFVGRYPIPMRHGLTMGELARLFNGPLGIGASLQVIPMRGWHRTMHFTDTGLPWVPPSPNLPTPGSAMVYPGQVIWEGTNISEGRGTSQPFELFGAPFIEPDAVLDQLAPHDLAGVVFRPIAFEPTANKWKNELCRGFQLHVTDPGRYAPYRTSLCVLSALHRLYPEQLRWKPPPYEYEYTRLPIDLIIGDRWIREQIEADRGMEAIERSWQPGLEEFKALRQGCLLYPS